MKKAVVLGAGLVAKPLVRYLLEQPGVEVIVASRTVSKADALVNGHPKGRTQALNVQHEKLLENLIADADAVVSLLPYTYHEKVARYCIKNETHLVTTSYVSPAIKELDKEANEKGLLLLNETGLDPGIDHMSAMKMIDSVRKKGGTIVSFESCCGGLPAPEANDNPFGYKFSWSPRGVLMAGRNSAYYLKDGKEVKIAGKDLFKNYWQKPVQGLGTLQVYPNRDSMQYRDLYGLFKAETVFRGTFRNPGWCETLEKIAELDLLDETQKPELNSMTWARVTAGIINASGDDLRSELVSYLGIAAADSIMDRLEWLGLLSEIKVKAESPTLLDALTALMLEKMAYKDDERDMIVLQHDFIVAYPDGKREAICSLLVDYGIPNGDSSMSRTVSLPAAIAMNQILNGTINLTGVRIPVDPEIYIPVLDELEGMNIKFVDTFKSV